ncbi:MAG: heavy-metal-associated domain-containing protein [Bacteroidales bacterium]|jgi:copper chaperone CopZ
MKTLIKSLTLVLVALFVLTNNINAQDKKIKKDAEVTFSVSIDCPSCVKKLEAKLPFENGVKDLKVDLETKTVWFKYQSDKTTKEKLASALDKLGYPAKEIEPKK